MGFRDFSLSTSWNYARHSSARAMISEIKGLGFESVELNFALTRAAVDDVSRMKNASLVRVSSLHNMCPLPDGLDPAKASPDHFSLSSTDGSERSMAVKAAFVTIDCAARLGAAAVVLHAGRVEIMDRTRQLAGMSTDPGAAKAVRDMMIKERAGKAAPHIESVLRSIDEIIPYAKKAGIAIGLENRYYYREIPTVDEFEAIFARFGREDIYYWHDVGHAEVFERLGLARHEDLLSRFAGRLLGVHLHDIIGNISDHHAPGSGTFDFSMIKRYVRPDTIKVIEAHDQASGTDISNAVSVLSRIL